MPESRERVDPLIVIASNRGPYSFKRKPDGTFTERRGEGGLVTALAAIADNYDVLWIAAALSKDDQEWVRSEKEPIRTVGNMQLRLLVPDRKRYRQYYNVIANPLLWFIQHQLWDLPRNPEITQKTWTAWTEGYVAINRHFAAEIAASLPQDDDRPIIIFPQDYHLYLVPHFLREKLGDRVYIQPFIHIPWAGPDAWRMLPSEMRITLLKSLLASDRIGFQTATDAFNFIQTCRLYLDEAHSYGSREWIQYQGRKIYVTGFPISVDVEKVTALANDPHTRLIKRTLLNTIGDVPKLIMRTDRIEPSKNILRGLLAFRALLEMYPEHRGNVKLLQLLVPSRMDVPEYKAYLEEVMALASMINADFSDEVWEPVRTIIGNNYARALAAMQLYDVLLVNPVTDGMNLVAKEGPLVNQRDGVVILSEYAGAVYELGDHTLTISPYDIYSTAQALHQALTMPPQERHQRAEGLRQQIRENDINRWFYNQLNAALTFFDSASKNDSTPSMPDTSTSDNTRTDSGVASDSTPTDTP